MSGSWVDKVSGESKWFKASRLERQGKLEEAMNLYLEEAREQEAKSLALSALSMLSAAKCAAKLGEERASEYFKEAGRRYEKYGDSILSISPNSSAWAYKMASRCYNWAGDQKAADNVLKKAESLSEKIGEKVERYFPLFKQYRPKKDER
ncbi:MAG: hypothetical protein B6U65_00345 [Candidatus Wolframiiraptor sp. EX4484-121]|nr:MAG: hypothetical protein B6U65_00345 [Candidatus Wolframiiraptor sp. EX4484-121]